MMASRKIKPGKKTYKRGDRSRKPVETAAKRVMDVAGLSQVGTWEATNFVSLPREPWDRKVSE